MAANDWQSKVANLGGRVLADRLTANRGYGAHLGKLLAFGQIWLAIGPALVGARSNLNGLMTQARPRYRAANLRHTADGVKPRPDLIYSCETTSMPAVYSRRVITRIVDPRAAV